MTGKAFSGNLADLRRRQGDDRAELEAGAVAKVDGRKLRRKGRTEQMAFRFAPERRAQIERLALAHGRLTFVEVVERSLDVLEAVGVEQARAILAGVDPAATPTREQER